jgi:crotonobetainyl-CoA:carnitine CoA-transferase CaiB-like acyl-CoA transferase
LHGESASFLSADRNKGSVDLARPGGRELIRALAMRCDVPVENFDPPRSASTTAPQRSR